VATEALNFKRIGTPSYRTYRVLSARGDWAQLYRSKVADHGDQKGAIIFPEQLLSLNQNRIFAVAGISGSGAAPIIGANTYGSAPVSMTLSCLVIERFHLWNSRDQCLITKAEQVVEYEEQYYDKEGLRGLMLTDIHGNLSRSSNFASFTSLFTSKRDAVRWLENYARENLRKMIP
jgi:hypothetical protein